MKRACLPPLLAIMLCLGGASLPAASLEKVAGSYTGRAVSIAGGQSLSASATLTFTGKPNVLNGTFLYNGILTAAGLPEALPATHTLKFNSQGRVRGRVTLGPSKGNARGKVKLSGKILRVKIKYRLDYHGGTTIDLDGKVTFSGKRAVFTTSVKSSDPVFLGSLNVTGKR